MIQNFGSRQPWRIATNKHFGRQNIGELAVLHSKYLIAQNFDGENFGKLIILEFWQGKILPSLQQLTLATLVNLGKTLANSVLSAKSAKISPAKILCYAVARIKIVGR